MIRRRRLLGEAASLAALAALPGVPAAAATPALPFLAVGDWGRKGQDHQIDVARAMAADAQTIRSRFVISTGDNFYEKGVSGLDDPHWQESFEQVYSQNSLQTPWRLILGNHDYRGNVEAQLRYGATDKRWYMPSRTYTLAEPLADGSKAEFFYLDTSPFITAYIGTDTNIAGQDTAAQLRWLDAALGASTARWKIVVGHHPIYLAADKAGFPPSDLIGPVDPILRAHGVHVYINGHVHALEYVERGGIHYITTGAGSKTDNDIGTAAENTFASRDHGFMRCQLTPEALDFAFVTMDSKTIFTKSITRV